MPSNLQILINPAFTKGYSVSDERCREEHVASSSRIKSILKQHFSNIKNIIKSKILQVIFP